MYWLMFVVTLAAAILMATANDYDNEFIDPYTVDNTFHLDCGSVDNKIMHILFRGDAHKVFAPDRTGCEATEVEPGHFEIEDAMYGTICQPTKVTGLEVYTLELVVQKGYVRRFDDPIHVVTCNYEMGGQQQSNLKETDDSILDRKAELQQAYNETSESSVSLSIRDVNNEEISQTYIGSYVQLVAFMTPVAGEVSFRIWNCRAFTNETGQYVEHYFLIDGCGDDNVIHKDRGFRTSALQNDAGVEIREARSVYFRTFALLGSPRLQFECDYIVRPDTSADGPSCAISPAALNAGQKRKKRSVKTKRSIMDELTLPSIESDELTLLPRPAAPDMDKEETVITYKVSSPLDFSSEYDESKMKQAAAAAAPIATIEHPMGRPRTTTVSRPRCRTQDLLAEPLVIGLLVCASILVVLFGVAVVVLCTFRHTRFVTSPSTSSSGHHGRFVMLAPSSIRSSSSSTPPGSITSPKLFM